MSKLIVTKEHLKGCPVKIIRLNEKYNKKKKVAKWN